MLKTSERSVERAKKINREGTPELQAAVESRRDRGDARGGDREAARNERAPGADWGGSPGAALGVRAGTPERSSIMA